MKKVDQININLKRVLSTNDIYKSDWYICINLISKRDFQGLQELIKSIIKKEEMKKKVDRIINYNMLIEAKVLIDDYIEQWGRYIAGCDPYDDDVSNRI